MLSCSSAAQRPAARKLYSVRLFSRPSTSEVVLRVSENGLAYMGSPKEGPKPGQLLELPPFPASFTTFKPLPGRKYPPGGPPGQSPRITAVTWLKYYFADVHPSLVQHHFNKGMIECNDHDKVLEGKQYGRSNMQKVRHNDAMKAGMRLFVPVSIAESSVPRRYDTIPSATLHPNADEIDYFERLVVYKDAAIIVLNKPPKLPVKGNLPIQNSMDALAQAAFSYGSEDGPKLVHKLDRESTGLILFGRTKDISDQLNQLFNNVHLPKSINETWNEAGGSPVQRYWALVIGSPKKRQGVVSAPLSKALLNKGRVERIVLAHPSGIDGFQDAVTEYRVMGPTINGCSWVELCPLTSRKHQLRIHCAEVLGTPIVGDYEYGWYVHQRWKQTSHLDYEPSSAEAYKLRRPDNIPVQKGSVFSKVPLLHLHCREMVIPNIAKFQCEYGKKLAQTEQKPDVLHFVAPMPNHMKISWNLMSSYLV